MMFFFSLWLLQSSCFAQQAPVSLGREASKIRGLKYRSVPSRHLTQKQAGRYVVGLLKKELKPRPTLAKETFLKRLGLMPRRSTIFGILSKLYASQVRGIYDPSKKIFIVVKGSSGKSATDAAAAMLGLDMTDVYTVHELQHAIQDQHFNLSRISRSVAKHSDRAFAAQSVIEGDATLVMMDYTLKKAGLANSGLDLGGMDLGQADLQGLDLSELGIDMSELGLDQGGLVSGPMANAPLYFQKSLSEPYEQGLRFVSAIRKRRGWKAVNRALRQVPRSSEHIYHPEKYLAGRDLPRTVSLAKLPRQLGSYKMVAEDTAGEFTLRVLAQQYKRSMKGAEGWGGDRYRSYHNGKHGFSVWHTVWDTAKDAREFSQLMEPILRRRRFADKKLGAENLVYKQSLKGRRVHLLLGVPKSLAGRLSFLPRR